MNRINDRWLFYFVYPLMGVSIVHIGNDNPFGKLIRIPSYYTDVALALIVLYAIGIYFRWIFNKIDNRYDWETEFKKRTRYQFLWALLVPTIFALLVEIVYLRILGIPLSDSPIFYLELPVILGFFTLINLIYFILYFRWHNALLNQALKEKVLETEITKEKYLIAQQGGQKINIPNKSIAYFLLKNKLTFLVTIEGKQHLYDKTMKEVLDMLPKDEYYQLNRQVIARRSSIVKYSNTETRRLKIELNPPVNEDIFIAKAKAGTFLKWLDRQ